MSPRAESKRAKRDARHARRVSSRVSRRALLKGAGAAAIGAAASLFFPRMVHAIPKPLPHPTWDLLLNHVGANRFGLKRDREPAFDLREWVHGLILHPSRPQRALLLTGLEANGKALFHDAMGLLLPTGGVVQMPEDMRYPPLDLKSEW